jgi:hypothetical protein
MQAGRGLKIVEGFGEGLDGRTGHQSGRRGAISTLTLPVPSRQENVH